MKKRFNTIITALISCLVLLCACAPTETTVELICTTDIHGSLFPYNYITGQPTKHSLAQVATYIEQVRDTSDNVILVDAGDMLQGTPAVYYYNFVDTVSNHVLADIYNYMQYDAVCVGNHDIETGHNVYDKVFAQMKMPVLAGNAIYKDSGDPYFKPYTIIERGGRRIAIIGLITPHIPFWLQEKYWEGMDFEDMIESAQKWMDYVKKNEKPDAVIGLFHSGYDYTYGNQTADTYKNENASILVGERVEGFDCIIIGHDHRYYTPMLTSPSGHKLPLVDTGTAAHKLGHLTLHFNGNERPKIDVRTVVAEDLKPSDKYMAEFEPQEKAIREYSSQIVGTIKEDIYSNEALFGSCKFMDILHRTMMKHAEADISFTAPLRLNANIEKGDLTVGDMFNLYKFENTLNSIRMTGDEVRRYLEYSYNKWISNPAETGHILLLDEQNRIKHEFFNFDAAAGIRYTVNPFKPFGERVEILSMMNGAPFDLKKTYIVAINSYRFNGGGGHLTQGLGWSKEEIDKRLVKCILKDLRGLTLEDLQEKEDIEIPSYKNWKFVPESSVKAYIEIDNELIKKE